MDFFSVYSSIAETPLAKNPLPESLDSGLGTQYLFNVLEFIICSIMKEKGLKQPTMLAEELWGNRIEDFNSVAFTIEIEDIAESFREKLWEEQPFLNMKPAIQLCMMPLGNKRKQDEDSSNYAEELRDSDDDVIGADTQSFAEATEVFHALELSNQNGSGFEMQDALQIELLRGRWNEKYKANQLTFRARVSLEKLPERLQNTPMAAAVSSVRELFRSLLRRTNEGLRPTDLIRIYIQADGLDKPISTRLMSVSELTLETVMAAILKVLQSKDQIAIDSGFSADVVTIRRDVGAGRRKVINTAVDPHRKQSILEIPSDDEGLCCAKAILYALAHLEKNQTAIDALRDRRRSTLLNRARALHEAAGVRIGPCTYKEVAQFEEHLNVQIVVIATENMQKVSYKGIERPRWINLWLHDEHYDVIKGLNGFYGTHFYCEECEVAYHRREEHWCANSCRICLRKCCVSNTPERCDDCDRLCRSEECYLAHKSISGKQQLSICDLIYQCKDCCKVIHRRKCPKDQHRCGTVKCPSCDQFVVADEHRCYLRRVPQKKQSKKLIFFDFETDQTLGEHVVNFAVAQYAAQKELEAERIFKGYSACAQFCSWLFSPEHKGYTAIAHNMKG
ncbi:uncharacterized protein LOC129218913 [Uloborus diversus]|uniref:uncharacterized protein LOC129218913 n=1 Tax=Uloborus diversus TaxID=327109 RepID=UPI0024090E92|nr:uncharacterized protein LOC129218913 [Uloborus diversus]